MAEMEEEVGQWMVSDYMKFRHRWLLFIQVFMSMRTERMIMVMVLVEN